MSAHLHEWADLIFGFKQKGEMSKLLSIFFWLQLKGYSFSALELKLYQEAVLCKGGTHKFVLKSEPWAQKTREKASVECRDKVLTLD